MQRCFSFRASAHVADIYIDLAVIAGDAGRAGALPHLAGDGAAGHVIMGVPDGVLAQLAQIQPVAEPPGGGVHARLVAQRRTNKEIAETLHLSEGTVKQYINQLYAKLDMGGDPRTRRARLAEWYQKNAPRN